ncbi:MAG: TIGR03067 domain-containing protein [Planctomycetia bacterium]|nr:TIGR03067 domain-containing protein [Planctomycetia bacterium]
MRALPAFALIGLLAFSGSAVADEKDRKATLKQLEGTYLIIGFDGKGLKLTEDDFKPLPDVERKIVIKGDQIIANLKGKEDVATIKLDPSQKPPHFTVIDKNNTKDYGIYKFENGLLLICSTEGGLEEDRPKEFKGSDKAVLITLKKVVPKGTASRSESK